MQKFFKMSCAGNRYLFTFGKKPRDEKIGKMCCSLFGYDSDGVVTIKKRGKCYQLKIYNSDASYATFCGNATMSVAKYLFDHGLVNENGFTLYTGAGQKRVRVLGKSTCKRVVLGVGKPTFRVNKGQFAGKSALNHTFEAPFKGGKITFVASVVWVGNLHLVVTEFLNNLEIVEHIVEWTKNCGLFPKGVNVEFVTLNGGRASAVVYERGSGRTLACGSGCVAIFAVLNRLGVAGESLTVNFEGGRLKAFKRSGEFFLSGVPRYLKLEGKNES